MLRKKMASEAVVSDAPVGPDDDMFVKQYLAKKTPKEHVPGWARTTSLSVNSRAR